MMNVISIIGRLTKDPVLTFTATGKEVARFAVAINRPFDKENADFLNIVVWGKRAVNCANHLAKGRRAGIVGRVQTRSYKNDGQKRYATEVIASEVEFLEWGNKETNSSNGDDMGSFEAVDEDDEVPF